VTKRTLTHLAVVTSFTRRKVFPLVSTMLFTWALPNFVAGLRPHSLRLQQNSALGSIC
jgi:hypothetical protein